MGAQRGAGAGQTARRPRLLVAVEVDRPGIPEVEIAKAVRCGKRLDETVPGSGLGLDIVRDIAELYRGSMTLGRSALGGLSARLDLPASG